jgi:hypothetical protein
VQDSDVLAESPSDVDDADDTPQKPVLPQGPPCVKVELSSPTQLKKDACKEPMVARGEICACEIVCGTLTQSFWQDVVSARRRDLLSVYPKSVHGAS